MKVNNLNLKQFRFLTSASIPLLSTVLLQSDGKSLWVSGNNGVGIAIAQRFELNDGVPFEILVDYTTFNKILGTYKAKQVAIKPDKKGIWLQAGKAKNFLRAIGKKKYPMLEWVECESPIVNMKSLKWLVRKADNFDERLSKIYFDGSQVYSGSPFSIHFQHFPFPQCFMLPAQLKELCDLGDLQYHVGEVLAFSNKNFKALFQRPLGEGINTEMIRQMETIASFSGESKHAFKNIAAYGKAGILEIKDGFVNLRDRFGEAEWSKLHKAEGEAYFTFDTTVTPNDIKENVEICKIGRQQVIHTWEKAQHSIIVERTR